MDSKEKNPQINAEQENSSENKTKTEAQKPSAMDKLKVRFESILFDLITDIPDSLYRVQEDPDEKVKRLTQQAALRAAAVSTTLSVPAGVTGMLTSIPDIAAVWRIQAQLVADIAATYGKVALLSREAMVWCLFRHSATQLLKDIAIRTGSRVIVQKISMATLRKLLQKIGVHISSRLVSRVALRAIPALGALGNGAYTYYDTNEVGKTAAAYFRALSDAEATDTKVAEEG